MNTVKLARDEALKQRTAEILTDIKRLEAEFLKVTNERGFLNCGFPTKAILLRTNARGHTDKMILDKYEAYGEDWILRGRRLRKDGTPGKAMTLWSRENIVEVAS